MSTSNELSNENVEYSSKFKIKYQLQDILIYILISMQLLYPLKQLVPSYLQVPIFAFWFFIVNFKYCSSLRGMLLIVVIIVLKLIQAGNFNLGFFDPLNILIEFFQLFVWYSIFLYIKDISKERKRRIVITAIICISISVLFSLYYVFFVDPQAIRNTQRQFLWGAGDFELMYALAMFVGCLVCVTITKIKYKVNNKYIIIILLFFCILILLKCNLVTALVLSVFSCALGFLTTTKYKNIYTLLCVLVLPVLYLIKEYIAIIFLKLSKISIFYKTTQEKLIAIANLLIGSGSTDTLGERYGLMMQSINTFIKNPIFGVGFSNYKQGAIGGHAQWFDDLATFGILGFVLLIIVLYNCFSKSLQYSETKLDINCVKLVWIIYVVLGFLNPNMMGAVYVIMFIVAPFISFATIREDNSEYE